MIGGIVEISESGRHLSVYRGFLKVTDHTSELGRVPLDDITALLLSGPQITLSKNLMVALAERKAVIVICGKNWHPVSFSLPYKAHFESAGILQDQIKASRPLQKRLWQQIVQAKIDNQTSILLRHNAPSSAIKRLEMLRKKTKSGDPDNTEAQAARYYWTTLMGTNFRRDRLSEGINAFLNYGYTVLRAATARATCAAGLHPALGIHHGSRVNMYSLVDDLMEPFRPLVDSTTKKLLEKDASKKLSVEHKRIIASVLQEDMLLGMELSPVANCLTKLTRSLASSLASKKAGLTIAQICKSGRLL